MCSPFMTSSSMPELCKEYTPSEDNDYVRLGPGWATETCLDYVGEHQEYINSQSYSLLKSGEDIPSCLCHPPYGGVDCLYNKCPKNSEFKVCSGNGNKSVGLVRNDTLVGDGCQCQNFVSLFDLIANLNEEEVRVVTGKYVNDFRLGFCGTPVKVPGGVDI